MTEPKTTFENLFFTTLRIETHYKDGTWGTGTGFMVSYDHKDGKKSLYLVTNKHVIESGIKWKFKFNKSKNNYPVLGDHALLEMGRVNDVWIRNDKFDIAILYWNKIYKILEKNKKPPFIRTINYKSIPNQNTIDTLIDAIENILLLGYPNGIFDPKSLIPVVRRGITATPYSLDFEGEPKFLIDASIFPGSSGSPVLICDRKIEHRKGGWNTEARTFLLGILSEGYFRTVSNSIISKTIPTTANQVVKSEEMLDLGIVYKSSIIKKMIDEHVSSIVDIKKSKGKK